MKQLRASQTIRRLARDRSVRATLFAFTLSRGIVLVILVLFGMMTTAPDPQFSGHVDAQISVRHVPFARLMGQEVATADVNWYLTIVQRGYDQAAYSEDEKRNWAFFPVFPLLWRQVAKWTGDYVLTGMALSHLFFLVALFLLHRVCVQFGLGPDDADRAVFYLAVFPTSYFFSMPLPESLFLMLTIASFYFAKGERWWLAGVFGALASGTRTSGVLLLPALAVLYWETYKPALQLRDVRTWRKDALALLLVPVGLVAFMVYLHFLTGNALAFKGAMAAWGRQAGFFVDPLIEYLRSPSEIAAHWNFKLVNFLAVTLALACGVVLLKRRQYPLAIFALLSLLVALSSALLQSQARYAMVVFPIYIVLADWGRRAKVDQLIRAVFVAVFALMTALFAAHYTLALS